MGGKCQGGGGRPRLRVGEGYRAVSNKLIGCKERARYQEVRLTMVGGTGGNVGSHGGACLGGVRNIKEGIILLKILCLRWFTRAGLQKCAKV